MNGWKPLAVALVLALAAGTGAPGPAAAQDRSVFDVLLSSPRYRNFVKLAQVSGMDVTLMSKDDITVLVPGDRALAAMGEGNLRALMQSPTAARRLVGCHVIGQELRAGDLYNRAVKKRAPVQVRTLGGCRLSVTGKDGKLFVNGRSVVKTNIPASNGLVQKLNGVLR